jgi:hypothetical protein
VARDRVADVDPVEEREVDHQPLQRDLVQSLLLRERRPDHQEFHVGDARERPDDGLEALRRRRPPEREQRQRVARGPFHARQVADVDPVPDRHDLARLEGERPLVDAQDEGRQPSDNEQGSAASA